MNLVFHFPLPPLSFYRKMSTFTPHDINAALLYAAEKLRQERISMLKSTEPSLYSYVKIEVVEDGWEERMGLIKQPGQKLAPYRHITYDTSNYKCSEFSFIPEELILDRGTKYNPSATESKYAQRKTIPPFTRKDGEEKDQNTFTNPCCTDRKQTDRNTRLPETCGVLQPDYMEQTTGETGCQYLKRSINIWDTVPCARPVDQKISVCTAKDVPEMGYTCKNYRTTLLSRAYCDYFKRYYGDKKGEIYRSGWLIISETIREQNYTNSPALDRGNMWAEVIAFESLVGATYGTAARDQVNSPLVLKRQLDLVTEALGLKAGQKIDERYLKMADAIMDTALRLHLLKVSNCKARHILLKGALKASSKKRKHFKETLKLVGATLAVREAIYCTPIQPPNRTGECMESVGLVDKQKVVGNEIETVGTCHGVWNEILQKACENRKDLPREVKEKVRAIAENVVTQFMGVLSGKSFTCGYESESNIQDLFGIEKILDKIACIASKMSKRFADTAVGSRLFSGFVHSAYYASEKLTSELSVRLFSSFVEETIVEVLVVTGLRRAIKMFTDLAATATCVRTSMGCVLMVLCVTGFFFDLSLKFKWGDSSTLSTEMLQEHTSHYNRVFTGAGKSCIGAARPVSHEEIVGIDLQLQTEERVRQNHVTGIDFTEGYFIGSPLLEGKSIFAFMQEASQEYLGSRTMNSYGQRILKRAVTDGCDSSGKNQEPVAGTADPCRGGTHALTKKHRKKVGKLVVRNVAFSALAGFSLIVGLGSVALSHVKNIRYTNITMSISFIGLLVFIALMGIVYLNILDTGTVETNVSRCTTSKTSLRANRLSSFHCHPERQGGRRH